MKRTKTSPIAMLCGLRPTGWTPPRPGIYKVDPNADWTRCLPEDLARDRHLQRQRALQDEALRLREEGLSYREIAEKLNYSEAKSAAAAVDRARARRERALENADQDIDPSEAIQDEDEGGLWGLSFQAIAEELPTERPRKGRVA